MKLGRRILMLVMILALLLSYGSVLAETNTLTMPAALQIIDEEAFYGDRSIDKVELGDEVEEIRDRAFADSSLSEINLPDSLTFIDDTAFDGLKDVEVTVNTGTYAYQWAVQDGLIQVPYTSPDNFTFSFEDSDCIITGYIGSDTVVRIPEVIEECTVRTIGYQAFRSSRIENIWLPDGLTEIGYGAFDYCSSLEAIEIPEGVTAISSYAFRGCSRLSSISLPSTLTSIGKESFSGCSTIQSIHIPDSVTSISEYAFSSCSNLESINYPMSWKSVGIGGTSSPFTGCTKLTYIEVPEGITSLPDYAFRSTSLKSVSLPSTLTDISYSAFDYCSSLEAIEIPEGVTAISSYAFRGCSRLNSIFIGPNITSISNSSFDSHSNSLVVYGKSGSYAQIYAEEKGINFSTGTMPSSRVTLSGMVKMDSGYGVPNVKVSLYSSSGEWVGTTYSNYNGNWSFSGLNAYTIYRIVYSAEPYTIPENRQTVFAQNVSDLTAIAKLPDDALAVSESSIVAESAAATLSVYVEANKTWQFSADCNWIMLVAEREADDVSGVLKLTISENTGDMRFANVTVFSDSDTLQIPVLQKGTEDSRLGTPTITYPAADGDIIPYGDIDVVWDTVEHSGWYVISLRDLTTDELLIFHGTDAMTGENTARLYSSYFFPGRDYRIAIGAVPTGIDSTNSVVGWCERIIHVEDVETATTATLFGKVMGNTLISSLNENEDETSDEHIETSSLENAMVVLVQVTDGDGILEAVVWTDVDGLWRIENCKIGAEYLIYAMNGDNKEDVTSIEELDEDDLQLRLQVLPGDNDTGIQTVNLTDSSEVIRVATQYMADASLQGNGKVGLLAEFFQGGKNEKSASAKRWESSVSAIDFSWKDARVGVYQPFQQIYKVTQNSSDYNYLEVSHFDGVGTLDSIRYMKKNNMHVLFNGWLTVPATGDYSFRVTGDDGVRITIYKPDGKKGWSDDDGWLFGGKNQVAELKKVSLTGGVAYKISIEYYNNEGDANIKFEWKMTSENSNAYSIVPSGFTSHTASDRQVSVKNVSMETAAQMAALDQSIKDGPKDTVLDMAIGVAGDYIIGPAFDLGDKIYKTFADQAVDAVSNSFMKSVCEKGVEIILGKTVDPGMTNYDIREKLLEDLPSFVAGKGTITDEIRQKVEAFRDEWVLTSANDAMELARFYRLLRSYFPETYERVTKIVGPGEGMEIYYAKTSEELMQESNLETAAQEMIRQYKDIKGYTDYIKKSLQGVSDYLDPNRVRSYLHVLYLEDPTEALEYAELIKTGRYFSFKTDNYDISYIHSHFVEQLEECNNAALIEYLDQMNGKESNRLILLYKQILSGAIKLAAKKIKLD